MLRNQIYFGLKPILPVALRRAIRQRVVAHIRERTADVWPIFPGSERPPENWLGWPDRRRFAVILTHDVERQRGLVNCPHLMQLERDLGFRSSFNFVPEGNYETPAELRAEILANGFEVGVHDLRHDGQLFRSRAAFRKKADRINRYLKGWNASGFRSAFMLHKLDWLHDLDIRYDMSTFDTDPFEPQPDGCHTIFPFWVNRAASSSNGTTPSRNGSRAGYVELPYTLPQDSTLFLLLGEKTPEIWFRKIDWIADHGGMVLVNIHPDYIEFNGAKRNGSKYPLSFVRELLNYISQNYSGQFWNPTPGELADWYCTSHMSHRQVAAGRLQQTSRSIASRPLQGKRAAVVLFSHYPADPRPRRAAEALASEGVTVDLICLQADSAEPRDEIVNGVNVKRVRLKRRRSGKLRYAWQYSAFLARSFFYLAGRSIFRRYDFVHVHNMPDLLVFSALVPKLRGAKVFLDLHDPMPELMQVIFNLPPSSIAVSSLKLMEKCSIAFADRVVTVSSTFKNLFAGRSCRPDKITVVLNSPDEKIFRFSAPQVRRRAPGDLETPFIILYHGSLLQRNGFDLAVDALELVLESVPCAKLVVCGDSTPFFETVMSWLPPRGLAGKVEYRGACKLEGIVEAIRSCDVGIIPNHRNVFTELNTPTRIFECLALGKPVIAPRARGILDYFGENDLIYFELGNPADLARKLSFTFANPGKVEQIVARGQQAYLHHTWTSESEHLVNSFAALASVSH